MKWFPLFLFILLIPIVNGTTQDSILNCNQFSVNWWNPYSWFNSTRNELYNACTYIMSENLSISAKKLAILSLYDPDPNTFDYTFVNAWNKDLTINISSNVSGISRINKTYIKDAFFKFTAISPSVQLSNKQNTYVIPYNPTLKVDYGYNVSIPPNISTQNFPELTTKGYCKETYNLVNSSGQFDLFVDKIKSIGSNLDKIIPLNLSEQGMHTLDGLYKINIQIKATYSKWQTVCDSYDKQGNCLSYKHYCDLSAGSEIIPEQLILTDFKAVSIEHPVMHILNLSINGINHNLTARVTIKGLNTLQRFNFNNWYVKTNYLSKIIYLYSPINYLQLLAIPDNQTSYIDSFIQKDNNTFVFTTTPQNKNIFLNYHGFFFNNTIKANLTYKNFSYVDLAFNKFWYKPGDNVTIYPYVLLNNSYCKHCGAIINKVRINYNNLTKTILSNGPKPNSSVNFIYKKDVKCISVYYQGDPTHYDSVKCFNIPQEPSLINDFFYLYLMFLGFSILLLIVKFGLNKEK